MPRIFVLLSTLLVGLFALTIVFAQEPTPPPDQVSPGQTIPETVFQPPYLLQEIEPPFAFEGGGGGDTCALAAEMSFPNFGGQTIDVQTFTESENDPAYSCMWGDPPSASGWRTVWYKFTALDDTVVALDTITSNYDTVLGVFKAADDDNACTTLMEIACNDDHIGFSSRTTLSVSEGEEYYLMVAKWSSSLSGPLTLNLAMIEQPIDSKWKFVGNHQAARRTHHETVTANGYIYAIGGQESELDSSETVETLGRYHPASNTWLELPGMPDVEYTYLTAVAVNNRIYVPGGDDGTPNAFNDRHWVYDITANSWFDTNDPPPVAVGWSQAVANSDGTGYYLIGGSRSKPVISSTAQITNAVWFYDIDDGGVWLSATPMNTARAGHTAVRLGDRICVAGGLRGLSPLPGAECFQPTQGWQPIASLNISRFGAGSAVGPDGKWYVFGGLTVEGGLLKAVAETEMYDPARPASGWSILGVPYNLVERSESSPSFARAWARGERVGDHIYAIGGNHYRPSVPSPTNFSAVEVVQRLFVPRNQLFAPIIYSGGVIVFDDNMSVARPLSLNFWVNGNFNESTDFYDFYKINLNQTGALSFRLNNIPTNSNYDLFVFDDNKSLWVSSTNGGSLDETINTTLPAGEYYVLVQRQYGAPENSNYWLAVLR